ncbi:hypothetical protein D3C85_1536930 [compost metagenome]
MIRTIGSERLALWGTVRTVLNQAFFFQTVTAVFSQGLALWSAIRTIGSNGVLLFGDLSEEAIFLVARYGKCTGAEGEGGDGDQLAKSFHGGDSGRNQGFGGRVVQIITWSTRCSCVSAWVQIKGGACDDVMRLLFSICLILFATQDR